MLRSLNACNPDLQDALALRPMIELAAAVEGQDSATREIARGVQDAAAGTSEVSLNVAGASQAAQAFPSEGCPGLDPVDADGSASAILIGDGG
jgi:hypothetical protein